MRLAKYLAHCGVASRRAAERLIADGRVKIAGAIVTDPARDVAEGAAVEVDGRRLSGPERRVIYALNKPVGVVSTASDPQGRPTVTEMIDVPLRLYPVGRLDIDSGGLILLTNDGALANRLTHPRFEVPKTYRARLARGPLNARALRELRAGVRLEDGPARPARVVVVSAREIELTIHEGRNRQIRRMCEAVGYPVAELTRTAFGPLSLGRLAPGRHRRLSVGEADRLRAL